MSPADIRYSKTRLQQDSNLDGGGLRGVVRYRRVIGRHLNLPAVSVPAEDFGFLGAILAIGQPASSALTGQLLRWRPVQPGLIEDLDKAATSAGHAAARRPPGCRYL